jgi:RNA polymerase sigma factor (sigma-70 family)
LQLHTSKSSKPAGKFSISDSQHWGSMKSGDPAALELLYNRYAGALYNYGSKFTVDKDLIKECIQELFVNLWIRRDFISFPSDVKNYLFKSFRLAIFKKAAVKGKNDEYLDTESYPFSVTLNIEDDLIAGEENAALKSRLLNTIATLTDRQKEAIFLKFYENLSYEEIADVMGITVKATYKLMARSLNFLRDNLSKDDLMLVFLLLQLKLYN